MGLVTTVIAVIIYSIMQGRKKAKEEKKQEMNTKFKD